MGSAQQVTRRGRLPRADRFGGTSRCGSLTVRDVSFGGAWPCSRIRYDEGGHSRRFRLGRLGRVQLGRDDDRGDGPFGDGREYAGPGFRPVDVVPVRREGDLEDRVPVVLGRDYEVGFEEVGAAVLADKSVPDGLGDGAGQLGVGQAVLVQGNVGDFEPQGNRPDGTVKDSLRMARGYWEAKDSHDDLDAEIQAKFNRGYPRDNIIFEDSQTAVLVQNRNEAMRVDMSRDGELHRLIRVFLDYELPDIKEFRQAQGQFKTDLPMVLENLRATVAEAEAENPGYQQAADIFLNLCRKTIGPAVSPADVREMLLQHILTKDIFQQVFSEIQFHRENNVARLLDELEQTFFTGNVRRQAIDRLRTYYGAIGRAAGQIADYTEKQQFLKAIYEDFYTAYNPAAADRLGVVYTPNEVVDFIIHGADHLLQKHFGKTLADDNVQILDPATGTGTFVTNLINHLPADRLERKYLNEIHANEVAILPYYIANLNIEYTYQQRTGRYLEFPNLCFVDTLDNLDWQQQGATGGAVTRQGSFNLGGLSEENWIRIQEQNEKPISVIIGNPPYNDKAEIWGTAPLIEDTWK